MRLVIVSMKMVISSPITERVGCQSLLHKEASRAKSFDTSCPAP